MKYNEIELTQKSAPLCLCAKTLFWPRECPEIREC